MESKEKKWESGPHQHHVDKRVKEQAERAIKEAERQKENLDDKGEGSYVEKNGNSTQQFEDLKNEPKQDNRSTHPLTDDVPDDSEE